MLITPTITVSIESDVIRVAVFRRRKVVAWGWVARQEQPSGEGHDSADLEEADSSRLRALLKQLRVRRGRAVIALPLYQTMIRRFPILPLSRRFLDQVITSEVLESIPFSREEVDISWRLRKLRDTRETVATAVPKATVDSHVRLLRRSGLRPAAVYPRGVALGYTAGASNAIIVHPERTGTIVVLLRDGIPEAVRKVTVPEGAPGPTEGAEAVARAVEQMAGYDQTPSSRADGGPLPVALSRLGDGPLAEELRRTVQREVLPFAPGLPLPRDFPSGEFAPNIGLALVDRPGAFNLLPQRHLRRRPIGPAAAFAALVLLVAVGIYATGAVDSVASKAAIEGSQVAELEQQERQHHLGLVRADVIRQRVVDTRQRRLALEALVGPLDTGLKTLLVSLETITGLAFPRDVHVSSVGINVGGLVLDGTASSYDGLLNYASELSASGLFSDLRIERIEASRCGSGSQTPGGDLGFRLKASVEAGP